MKCLNCGTEMTNNHVVTNNDSISYDMCEQCGSLWLDAGVLDKMAFQVQGSIEYCEQEKNTEFEKQIRECPRCDDSFLDRVRFLESNEIYLHYCRNCRGFWLDGGELNLIDMELAKIMPVSGKGFSDFVNDVHVPYWYKRVKKQTNEADFREKVLPIKGAKEGKCTANHCPTCGTTLNLDSIFLMEIEGCPKCKGIWLMKDDLQRLKNNVEDGSLRWLNDEIENMGKTSVVATKRFCVRCKTVRMVSVIFGKSSVLIDWCAQCHGIWLEHREFEAITDYLKQELMRMHPRDIEKHAAEDVRRIWSGEPGSRFEAILDARAAVSALISATIFEHPTLLKLCTSVPRF